MGKFIDLIGRKFGKLTVIECVGKDKYGGYLWLCECECENKTKKNYRGRNLITGKSNNCGCETNEKKVINNKKRRYIPKLKLRKQYGEAVFNSIYASYVKRATEKNLQFELTKEMFKILTKGKCFYCGCEPNQIRINKTAYGNYIYNGIDRIDSSKGYIESNVVSCCGRCNLSKKDYSQQDFLLWIDRVYNHIHQSELVCS